LPAKKLAQSDFTYLVGVIASSRRQFVCPQGGNRAKTGVSSQKRPENLTSASVYAMRHAEKHFSQFSERIWRKLLAIALIFLTWRCVER
jgi:hypothetical protein